MLFPERLIYASFLRLYAMGIRIAALFHAKARKWLDGRAEFPKFPNDRPVVWMHCSSLGEFEQGRPVFESLRKQYPNHHLVLSFFSPSGYEIRKNYTVADQVIYFPLDTRENARRLIQAMRPHLVIWVKYEYWFNTLSELNQKNIPVLLISAKFNTSQPFFKWYGRFWRTQLNFFNQLFVQDEASLQCLSSLQLEGHIRVAGDTRYDRVLEIRNQIKTFQEVLAFTTNNPVLVAGSTWGDDLKLIRGFHKAFPHYKIILVPHEVDSNSLETCTRVFPDSVLYSRWSEGSRPDIKARVLVIDRIGMLSNLYAVGAICYVGGGFNRSGIHNTLEAAVWGKPVFFGPNYKRFLEAVTLVKSGGGFSVSNADQWIKIMQGMEINPEALECVGKNNEKIVRERAGATQCILDYIAENRLLTK
jgi:3-deoxy-D-manno-octulosonic-acid transferase